MGVPVVNVPSALAAPVTNAGKGPSQAVGNVRGAKDPTTMDEAYMTPPGPDEALKKPPGMGWLHGSLLPRLE